MSTSPNPEVAILNAALELPPAERAAYLDKACAGDADLRGRVEELLQAHERAGDFLEAPAPGFDPGKSPQLSVPLAEKPGDRIGPYKLLQQIGEGGCGVVYMAEQDEPVRRRVALKVIKLGMDTKNVIARFEAERQALALMEHPNIARVYDAGATGTGRPYFVMELVRGIKITDYCDENHLTTQERLRLFIQVCQAVQHAHQKGVIHRDIKPTNILVTVNDGVPVPKVIDFGIAKATQGRLTEKTLFTAFEQFLGTPAYMSPEQAVMTSLDIDTRSDIYGLGVLLYELLTGKTPFEQKELLASGLDEMRRTIREREPPKPSTRLSALVGDELTTTASRRQTEPPRLIHTVRGDLDWIVMKCLAKDRTRRYETANGLARDLERHLSHEPVTARPPSRLYELQRTVRRHWVGFSATAAIIAALAIGTVVSTMEVVRARRAEIERNRFRQQIEATQDAWRMAEVYSLNSLAWLLATSPEPQNRNGTLAVTLAERAVATTEHKDSAVVDTLAAAYAEAGNFANAISFQKEALAIETNKELRAQFVARQALYTAGTPYREAQTIAPLPAADRLSNLLMDEHKYGDAEQIWREILTPRFENEPSSAPWWKARADFYARRGLWREAAAAALKAVELEPTNHENYHCLAPLLAQIGDLAGYRHCCSQILLRFSAADPPHVCERMAKDCLFFQCPGVDLTAAAKLADSAVTRGQRDGYLTFFQFAQGLADYRTGNFSNAVDSMAKVITVGRTPFVEAEASAVLAMAQQRLGHKEEARAALSHGAKTFARMASPDSGDLGGGTWNDWIIANALLKEAEALIEDQPPPDIGRSSSPGAGP